MSIYDSATRIRLMEEAAEAPLGVGDEEGQPCNRTVDGAVCTGEMIIEREYSCSCHINPPCSACLDSLTCDTCGYRLSDEGLHPR